MYKDFSQKRKIYESEDVYFHTQNHETLVFIYHIIFGLHVKLHNFTILRVKILDTKYLLKIRNLFSVLMVK